MKYLLACYTDIGKRSAVNQDSSLVIRAKYHGQETVLAVVCDGMGGLKQGEVASAKVVHSFEQWFRETFPRLAKEVEFEDELYDSWEGLLGNTHREIREYGQSHGIRIGSTVTVMLLWQKNYYVAHVGDCRIYEIKDQIKQMTRDQVQANLTSKGEHILLQGIGASETIRPVYYSGEVKEDAVYLLCTDGFRHKVSVQELMQAFAPEHLRDEETMMKQGEKITKMVMERGEKDNISVLLLRSVKEQEQHKKQSGGFEEEFIIDRVVCSAL